MGPTPNDKCPYMRRAERALRRGEVGAAEAEEEVAVQLLSAQEPLEPQEAGDGKHRASPRGSANSTLLQHLDFSLLMSRMAERLDFCDFKSPSLW